MAVDLSMPVLVVDDYQTMIRIIRNLLNQLGFKNIEEAKDGRQALEKLNRGALAEMVEAGPIPASHGVVRWRLIDLVQWIWDEFGLSITKQTLSREMRALGFRKLSARPRHHGQKDDAIADFKKTSQTSWQR